MVSRAESVAHHLRDHVCAVERWCSRFETATRGMSRAIVLSDQVAASASCAWWWEKYGMLRDAIATLVDGVIRHEYDRPKAERTSNSDDIHWQKSHSAVTDETAETAEGSGGKPGSLRVLRTGESLDNLRHLLENVSRKNKGAKVMATFDELDQRIGDLSECLKTARENLCAAVTGLRVTKYSEETQELRLNAKALSG
ncbi:unnamed protein product, partial [Discosporangium mesarthrocarpum]